MALTKDQKVKIIDKLAEDFKAAKSLVFSGYQGISVKDMQALRKQLREKGARYHVVKKTLIRLAGKKAGLPEVPQETLPGAVGVALGFEDEIAPAKVLHTFGKTHEYIKLLSAIMEGKVMSLEDVKYLATLPGKEELLTKLVYLLKSPISGFHGVLYGIMRNFVYALVEINKKKI